MFNTTHWTLSRHTRLWNACDAHWILSFKGHLPFDISFLVSTKAQCFDDIESEQIKTKKKKKPIKGSNECNSTNKSYQLRRISVYKCMDCNNNMNGKSCSTKNGRYDDTYESHQYFIILKTINTLMETICKIK